MIAALDYSDNDPAPAPATGPHNIEVEQSLLGAILINNAAYERVAPFLRPEHFFDPIHRRIFEVCAFRITEGRVADPKTLRTYFDGVTKIGDITIAEYLGRLVAEAVTLLNAAEYGRIILDLSVKRRIVEVAEEAATAAKGEEPSAKVLEAVEGAFAELRVSHQVSPPQYNPKPTVSRAMAMIGDAHAGKRVGWPWMLPEISTVMDGTLLPGRLYGLLGASGCGKTSAVLQSLRFLSEQGVPFLFLSGEQEPEECVLQMHAQRLGIPMAQMLKADGLTQEEADRVFEDAQAIADLPWAIEKWTACRVSQLGMKIRNFCKRYGPGVIAIDNAKKVAPDNPRDSLAQQVDQVFGGMKALMGENGCAGILLMQRNSDFMKRRYMWPIRSDCYGGEGTLQNLDGCLTVFRAARWLKERLAQAENDKERDRIQAQIDKEQGRAWFGNLKNRFGEENRRMKVKFIERLTRFESYEREQPELV